MAIRNRHRKIAVFFCDDNRFKVFCSVFVRYYRKVSVFFCFARKSVCHNASSKLGDHIFGARTDTDFPEPLFLQPDEEVVDAGAADCHFEVGFWFCHDAESSSWLLYDAFY